MNTQCDITRDDIGLFCEQMAIMIELNSGLKIAAIEEVAACAPSPSMKNLICQIRDELCLGNSFSDACKAHPDHFDGFFCGVLSEAEGQGSSALRMALEQLANHLRKL